MSNLPETLTNKQIHQYLARNLNNKGWMKSTERIYQMLSDKRPKKCGGCDLSKPLSEFNKNGIKNGKVQYRSVCKMCRALGKKKKDKKPKKKNKKVKKAKKVVKKVEKVDLVIVDDDEDQKETIEEPKKVVKTVIEEKEPEKDYELPYEYQLEDYQEIVNNGMIALRSRKSRYLNELISLVNSHWGRIVDSEWWGTVGALADELWEKKRIEIRYEKLDKRFEKKMKDFIQKVEVYERDDYY
jgi:hypothetical protein